MSDERAEKIINMAHPSSVLDVGCAYGFMVRKFLERGIPAMGTDISEWCQKVTVVPENFILVPSHELPFKDKEFDLLYCEGVLEHVEEDNIDKTMFEFERVARQRILQVSFPHHSSSEGHVCLHDAKWWFNRIPDYTWLFMGWSGTDRGNMWTYKA